MTDDFEPVLTQFNIYVGIVFIAYLWFWLAWGLVTTDLFLYTVMAWFTYYVISEGIKRWRMF